MSDTLTRTVLARLTNVSPDTLRHYERKGVLPAPPRSDNGYRRYPTSAIGRVQLIQRELVEREADRQGALDELHACHR